MADELPARGRILLAWILAVAAFVMLGLLRGSTEAEFAFASAAIIPVLAIAWIGGVRHGFAAAVVAAGMWIAADLLSEREFREAWVPFVNGLTRLATYGLVAYLVAHVHALLKRETELATRDALTGLLNRRAFLEAGGAESSRARRYGHAMAIVFLDLDDFKRLNDSRGHAAGDAALRAVGAALRKSLRAADTAARLGGDEFAVILPEIEHRAVADAARKLDGEVRAVLAPFAPVGASVGVAWFERPPADFATALKAADALMYEMKRDGKGGVRMRTFAPREDPPCN